MAVEAEVTVEVKAAVEVSILEVEAKTAVETAIKGQCY
jgi:hypothetical protein